MTRFIRKMVHVCAGLVMCLAVLDVGAQPTLADKMSPKTIMSAYGYELKFTVDKALPKENWRHLQRLQIHIQEEIAPRLLASMGCETNNEDVSCEELAAASIGNKAKAVKKVKSLTYYVTETEWNANPGLPKNFQDATTVTNSEETAAGSTITVTMAAPRRIQLPDPACNPPYASPCYTRQVCVQYGGCSKVSTGCVQCSYP